MPSVRDRLGALRRDPRERVRMWRLHYFADACRLNQVATILRRRTGDRMAPAKRRTLDAFLASDESARSVLRLAVRGAREVAGRGRPETLGAEWMLMHAYAWRRLLTASVRDRPQRGLRLDAVPPASLRQEPGRSEPLLPEVRVMAEKLEPLRVAVTDDAPVRVDVLVPTIDLDHFFGGYIGKFNLAARLAARGHRVRIVTTDPVPPLPRSWRQTLERYAGLEGFFDRVEVLFGREAPVVDVHPDGATIASTWWTAHLAADVVARAGRERFLYLIQEYEPFTFPMGTWAALSEQSYRFPHTALFSTELLQEYFRRHRLGVYADGDAAGDAASAAFRNAITAVTPPTAEGLRARRTKRLLFYARPEPHAARNLFELGVLALREAVRDGTLRGWELRGIGTVALGRRLALGPGTDLELLPRSGQDAYAALLAEHDVGLALMHTPHPSLVPMEMASAGLLTVTSAFEHKTPAAMAAISSNLLTAEPTVAGVAAALAEAVAGAGDAERRVAGSAVDWPRNWDATFGPALLDRVDELLHAMTAAATLDAPPSVRRRFELFGALRGMAVVAVVVFHVASLTGAVKDSLTGRVAVQLGGLGVLVFFVISGFLLYRPFVAARARGGAVPSLRRFARRRVLRIVPPYWTALTLLAIFPGIVGVFSGDFWRFYGFGQLYWDESLGQGIPPAWTLCVEVTYYLLLPAWVLAFRRARLRWDLAALAAVALAGVVVQVLAARQQIPRVWADALPGQMPWFALGMALAIWSVVAEEREPAIVVRRPILCWGLAAAALTVMVATSRGGTLAEIAAALAVPAEVVPLLRRIALSAVLAVGLLLPAVFGERAGGLPRRVLAAAPVAFLGTVSYSLYLYHLTVAEWLGLDRDPGHFSSAGLGLADDLGSAPTPVLLALTLLVASAIAAVSYRFVERPFITGAGRSARAGGSGRPRG